MAPAHEEVASGGRRRRGRRNLSWGTLLCFGSQEASSAETKPWERSSRRQRKKRTVPVVDGGVVGTTAGTELLMRRATGTDEEESRKRKGLLRLPGCCFLPPARAAGREHSAMASSGSDRSKQRHQERTEQPPPRWRRSQSDKNSQSEAASRIQATGGSIGSRSCGAEQPRGAPPAETTRTFSPVVGLSVVVAVSMAGLLGGRLWAVVCVCAWLAARSRLRRRKATMAAAGEVVPG